MEYKTCKLKDIATVIMGQSPKGSSYNDKGNGKAFLQGNRTFGRLYPVIDTWTTEPNKIAKEKSILMSVRAPVGDLNIANQEICIGRGLCSIEMNNGNNKYLFYLLKYSIDEIKSKSSGTVFDSINRTELENIDIIDFDEEIQNKITSILFNIDKKIELNNQINDNLYELLKTEFKTKFYNKNSDAKILDFISNTIGGDWGKELPVDNYNTKVYCVRGADIPNMEYGNKGNAPTRYILEKNYNNKKLKPNNIIVEISGGSPTQSTGRTAYITDNILNMYDAPLLCTNFCRAIETKKNIYAPFVYMYLTLMYEDDIFFNWENGTTGIKNLALNDLLSNIKITQPNEEELNKYYILFNSIMNKISNNSNENIKLELLRDTLLPKLMNGEIDLDKIEI